MTLFEANRELVNTWLRWLEQRDSYPIGSGQWERAHHCAINIEQDLDRLFPEYSHPQPLPMIDHPKQKEVEIPF